MAVTAADVKAHFPEHASVLDATVNRWLTWAQSKHNVTAFGAKSDLALVALTAHLVELDKRRQAGATGPAMAVQSRSVADVSTTYASPSASLNAFGDAALASTNAGQLYLDLRQGVFADRVLE